MLPVPDVVIYIISITPIATNGNKGRRLSQHHRKLPADRYSPQSGGDPIFPHGDRGDDVVLGDPHHLQRHVLPITISQNRQADGEAGT